eukprot:79807-Chlamydomonas_euryale.AAC.1
MTPHGQVTHVCPHLVRDDRAALRAPPASLGSALCLCVRPAGGREPDDRGVSPVGCREDLRQALLRDLEQGDRMDLRLQMVSRQQARVLWGEVAAAQRGCLVLGHVHLLAQAASNLQEEALLAKAGVRGWA